MESYIDSIRSHIGSQCVHLPGVRAIILNGRGEVLLQRRTDMDCWSLPSGAVELNETATDALKREVREETDIDVQQAEPMALYSGPQERFTYPNGDKVQCFSVAFIVRDWMGSPKADGVEGSEVKFWPLEDLPCNLVEFHARTLRDFSRYGGEFFVSENFNNERKD